MLLEFYSIFFPCEKTPSYHCSKDQFFQQFQLIVDSNICLLASLLSYLIYKVYVYLFMMKSELIFAVKMLPPFFFYPSKRHLMLSSMFPLCITFFYPHITPQTSLNIFLECLVPLCHNAYRGQASKYVILCFYSINIFVLPSYLTCFSFVFFKQKFYKFLQVESSEYSQTSFNA